jgi:hypothetical protein
LLCFTKMAARQVSLASSLTGRGIGQRKAIKLLGKVANQALFDDEKINGFFLDLIRGGVEKR